MQAISNTASHSAVILQTAILRGIDNRSNDNLTSGYK